MKIQYQLRGDSQLFETIEQLKDYHCYSVDCRNPNWVEKHIIEIDVDSEEYIMKDISKEFHSALSSMAYDRGHSAGEDECRSILIGIVADLIKPIQAFEKRLRDDLTD